MKVLYYDCFAGISGDMNLGAMVDLGVEQDHLVNALKGLNLSGYEIKFSRQSRQGITGTKVNVLNAENHAGSPHHHQVRNLEDIEKIILASSLSPSAKELSLNIFGRIAKAEAEVHGMGIKEVHFHEVGAIDSIIDIVGAAICLERLGVDRIISSSVELGGGFVTCAHGTLPVPTPATAGILKGIPVSIGRTRFEMTTPTGAAILASTVHAFTDSIHFNLLNTGYGIGTRDIEIPNVLRLMLGEYEKEEAFFNKEQDRVFLVECNIDDMNPEIFEYCLERLFEAGALDAWITPIVMKKSRPAATLSALCEAKERFAVEDILLTETTTSGLRRQVLSRNALRRENKSIMTEYGEVGIKGTFRGREGVTFKPEFEDCRKLAREHGISIQRVYEAVKMALLYGEEDMNEKIPAIHVEKGGNEG
ncbi:MAG: nickel pincer cofactor biosynthesis protein LarC [Syntrophales bacterium]|nr:nickel pincer cofactor biosynthesis protein LarC [Syntrophales bacterium]